MKPIKLSLWRFPTALGSIGAGALTLLAGLNANAQVQWTDADIGAPLYAGSSSLNPDGSVTITGGGSDIWGTASQFHYYYAWAEGTSWDVSAQFRAFSGPANWSKVELMVAVSDPALGPQPGDAFISMMDTQPSSVNAPDGSGTGVNNGGVDQFRTTRNGDADWLQAGATPAPSYPNDWFRINRNGSVFTLYKSADGSTWTPYITIDTASATSVIGGGGTHFGTAWTNLVTVGVAITSHNNGTDASTGNPWFAEATIANLTASAFVLQPLLLKYNLAADWTQRGFSYETALALLDASAPLIEGSGAAAAGATSV